MTENGKTLVAAGVLAAAVGVYLEISYQQKVKSGALVGPSSAAASASASARAPRPPGTGPSAGPRAPGAGKP